MGKEADHFRQVKRCPANAFHRQGVGQVSKTSMAGFDSSGSRKLLIMKKKFDAH
jgi:hypothetical protein